MKRLILAVAFAMGIFGCHNGDDSPENASTESLIIGQWEWLQSTGGIAGWTLTPATEGYNQQIEFETNGNFSRYVADTLNENTLYTITDGETIYSSAPGKVIQYKEKSITQAILSVRNDTLVLGDNCHDCFIHSYKLIH